MSRQDQKEPQHQFRPAIYPHPPEERADLLEQLLAKDTGFSSYLFHGFTNLLVVLLLLCGIKILYQDISMRGVVLLNEGILQCGGFEFSKILLIYFAEGIGSLGILFVIRLHSHSLLPKSLLFGAYLLIQSFYFSLPVVFALKQPPAMKLFRFMFQLVIQLKMHSYLMTYIHYIQNLRSKEIPLNKAVDFLRIKVFLYFILCAPSVVFEGSFIRKRAPRKWIRIIKRAVVAGASALAFIFSFSQFQIPLIIQNPLLPWNGDLSSFITVILATQVMFLSGFVAYFFCFLNLTALLYDFGDFGFYDDWWNSLDVAEFWRKWNKPIHEWFTRHVYIESVHFLGVSKQVGMTLVFLSSAVLHEYFFLFTFNSRVPCFFIGMALQAPIVIIGKLLFPWKIIDPLRNVSVWASLSFSQNLLAFVYLREWVKYDHPINYAREFWCPAS